MTKSKVREIVEEIAERVNGRVREDYSGRGMYGRTCFGVVCEFPNMALEEAGALRLRGGVVDNMGRKYIVYWPNAVTE